MRITDKEPNRRDVNTGNDPDIEARQDELTLKMQEAAVRASTETTQIIDERLEPPRR